jgi:outer membrane protein OmpU
MRKTNMKNILLTTTALIMTAGVAVADVDFSGSAGAGVTSNDGAQAGSAYENTSTNVWSGIDLNVSASMTTDSGMTISVADDFGGGVLVDWDDDYRAEAQGSDLDTPSVTISSGNTTISFDNQAKDDLYDDSQSGDMQIDTSVGGMSIGLVLDTDATAEDAATCVVGDLSGCANPSFSYSVSLPMGGFNVSASGTDADDNGDNANTLAASYAMGDMTVTVSTDDSGAGDSVNEIAVATSVGGASVSVAADDNDEWSLNVGYTEGSVTLNVHTDQGSAWETNVSVDLGGGAAFKVSGTDADDFVAAGVTFSF